MQKTLLFIVGAIALLTFAFSKLPSSVPPSPLASPTPRPLWKIRSVDTMKYSRDLAREMERNASFDKVIDQQVKKIADTGASHIAIATPYDEEFEPFLRRWVDAARRYDLSVWFRGNFAGWEEWFDYPRISRSEHLSMTTSFITNYPDLFVAGDIFTPCPECENGGDGDPRVTGDIAGHRQFLIDSTRVAESAFKTIGKAVEVGYHSMNYDVAMAVMDKETTEAVGGIVAIDHYVGSVERMVRDINIIKERSGGRIYLGEFGAPIPDLNGVMNEAQQSAWLRETLEALVTNKSVVGLNYWVNVGGSTELWNNEGVAREAVGVLTEYYSRLLLP